VAVASAGPYANHLHLLQTDNPHQYLTTQFLQAGCPTKKKQKTKNVLKQQKETQCKETFLRL